MNSKPVSLARVLCAVPMLLTLALAQITPVSSSPQSGPVSYASVNQLNQLLDQLQQSSQSIQADLGKVRIEKWKTDSGTKRDSQNNVDSIQRNLQTALPEMINQLRAAPESVPATFKVYRNLSALFDVFNSIVESAGAFGSKDEFQSLQNDLSGLDQARRSFGDRVENISTAKEAELTRLRAIVQSQAAAPAAPPKKTIVDDTEPPKKPAPKKKPAAKPSTATKPADSSKPAPAPPKTPQ